MPQESTRKVFSTIELQVLGTLVKRGQLDRFQIASDAKVTLSGVDTALRSLTAQGLVRVSDDADRYRVDRQAVNRTIDNMAQPETTAVK